MKKVALLIILSVMICSAGADTLSGVKVTDTTYTKIYKPDVVVKAEKSRAGNVVTGVSLIALGCFGGTAAWIDAAQQSPTMGVGGDYRNPNYNIRPDVIYFTLNVMVIVAGIRLICP